MLDPGKFSLWQEWQASWRLANFSDRSGSHVGVWQCVFWCQWWPSWILAIVLTGAIAILDPDKISLTKPQGSPCKKRCLLDPGPISWQKLVWELKCFSWVTGLFWVMDRFLSDGQGWLGDGQVSPPRALGPPETLRDPQRCWKTLREPQRQLGPTETPRDQQRPSGKWL